MFLSRKVSLLFTRRVNRRKRKIRSILSINPLTSAERAADITVQLYELCHRQKSKPTPPSCCSRHNVRSNSLADGDQANCSIHSFAHPPSIDILRRKNRRHEPARRRDLPSPAHSATRLRLRYASLSPSNQPTQALTDTPAPQPSATRPSSA